MVRRSLLKKFGLMTGGLILSQDLLASPKTSTIRIAHITDTHIQPHIGAAKGFEKCLHHIQNSSKKIDFIINGGDAIMGSHSASENSIDKQWELYKNVLKSENNLKVYNCLGNHDIHNKKSDLRSFEDAKIEAQEHLFLPKPYYTFDAGNWKVLVLDSVQGKISGKGYHGKIDEQQFEWLKNELKNTGNSTPILIVSHIPILSACVFLDGKNFKNGEWRVPETWMHSDTEELVELFAKYPNVKLAISGHIHLSDRIMYNQVTYCCNGAVAGNWWMGSYKQTKPGYAVIDLYDDGTFENQYLAYS